MTLNPTEFGILSATQGYESAKALFSEQATVAAYLRFEAALARAEARADVIPPEAVGPIEAACRVECIDIERLRHDAGVVGYPIVPLVGQLAELAGDAGGWVHWGATTQDVMDTGLILQTREGLDLAIHRLDSLCAALVKLVERHRDTVMAGRSKIQHAAPITFGYKAAVWVSQLDRAAQRLHHLRREGLWLQFGGAVGTLAALDGAGLRVRALLADELKLGEPTITWHVARDSLGDLAYGFAQVNVALAKMGIDIELMMATETDEVREPFEPGRGTSSTMPQKRNPVLSEALVSAAKVARESVVFMLDAGTQDHERATSVGPLEMRAIAHSVMLAVGALDLAGTLVSGLEVNSARMRRNLDATRGQLMAEAAMMALAPGMGREKAHKLVHEACHKAAEIGLPLLKVLVRDGGLDETRLENAMRPESYLGVGPQMADAVLDAVNRRLDAAGSPRQDRATPDRLPKFLEAAEIL